MFPVGIYVPTAHHLFKNEKEQENTEADNAKKCIVYYNESTEGS